MLIKHVQNTPQISMDDTGTSLWTLCGEVVTTRDSDPLVEVQAILGNLELPEGYVWKSFNTSTDLYEPRASYKAVAHEVVTKGITMQGTVWQGRYLVLKQEFILAKVENASLKARLRGEELAYRFWDGTSMVAYEPATLLRKPAYADIDIDLKVASSQSSQRQEARQRALKAIRGVFCLQEPNDNDAQVGLTESEVFALYAHFVRFVEGLVGEIP